MHALRAHPYFDSRYTITTNLVAYSRNDRLKKHRLSLVIVGHRWLIADADLAWEPMTLWLPEKKDRRGPTSTDVFFCSIISAISHSGNSQVRFMTTEIFWRIFIHLKERTWTSSSQTDREKNPFRLLACSSLQLEEREELGPRLPTLIYQPKREQSGILPSNVVFLIFWWKCKVHDCKTSMTCCIRRYIWSTNSRNIPFWAVTNGTDPTPSWPDLRKQK